MTIIIFESRRIFKEYDSEDENSEEDEYDEDNVDGTFI